MVATVAITHDLSAGDYYVLIFSKNARNVWGLMSNCTTFLQLFGLPGEWGQLAIGT